MCRSEHTEFNAKRNGLKKKKRTIKEETSRGTSFLNRIEFKYKLLHSFLNFFSNNLFQYSNSYLWCCFRCDNPVSITIAITFLFHTLYFDIFVVIKAVFLINLYHELQWRINHQYKQHGIEWHQGSSSAASSSSSQPSSINRRCWMLPCWYWCLRV